MISFILNIPYTLAGLCMALFSSPRNIRWSAQQYCLVFEVRNFWWMVGYMKGGRAVAIGNIVLLGPHLEDKDLEHELIHVDQYTRLPIIFPVLYYIELLKRGYRNNKFEDEAYTRAGNIYKGK